MHKRKKLILSKETVLALQPAELTRIAGGIMGSVVCPSVLVKCPIKLKTEAATCIC